MKIINGFLKGRNIIGFNIEGTRPTMDRVKESVFGSIQNYVKDAIVLDLFAGSGNLGIEAISNGAKEVYFNDIKKDSIKVINSNIENFNIKNKSNVLNFDYNKCLDYLKSQNVKFNIVFLDPPYKDFVLNEVIDYMLKNDMLLENAIIVCEVNKNYLNDYKELLIKKSKKYGDKQVVIYEKTL